MIHFDEIIDDIVSVRSRAAWHAAIIMLYDLITNEMNNFWCKRTDESYLQNVRRLQLREYDSNWLLRNVHSIVLSDSFLRFDLIQFWMLTSHCVSLLHCLTFLYAIMCTIPHLFRMISLLPPHHLSLLIRIIISIV